MNLEPIETMQLRLFISSRKQKIHIYVCEKSQKLSISCGIASDCGWTYKGLVNFL